MAAPDLAHKSHFGADLTRVFHMHAPENRWVFVDTRLHRHRSLAVARRDHQAAPTESTHAHALVAIRAIFQTERARLRSRAGRTIMRLRRAQPRAARRDE